MLLERFKAEVSKNPDIAPYAAELRRMAKEREKDLIRTMILSLYVQDTRSLRRDLLKIEMLGTAQATSPSQRSALLRCLFGVVALYVDVSDLLVLCDQIEEAHKDSSPALDTRG